MKVYTNKELGIPYETCPICGCKVTLYGDYKCRFCDRTFSEDEMEFEELRHILSPFICNLTEETAVECHIETNPSDEVGGPILIDKIFEFYDGTQWAHFYGTPDDEWWDIYDFTNDALKDIIDYFVH